MQRTIPTVATIALSFVIVAPSHAGLNACAADKMKCVAKKTQSFLKCHTLAEKRGVPVSDPAIAACLQKAAEKFGDPIQGCFNKVEQKTSLGCVTVNDEAAIEAKVDAFVDDVVTDLDPSYPAATRNQCSAAKKKCVAKKAAALLKCHAKNEKPPGIPPEKFAVCLQRAKDKFDGGAVPSKGCFAKLEAKFSGACLTTGDTAALEVNIDAFVDDVVCELDSTSGTCPAPTPTPAPTIMCSPGPTPSPNPNHACCVIIGYGCADIPPIPGAECGMFGGTIIVGGYCQCGGGCLVP